MHSFDPHQPVYMPSNFTSTSLPFNWFSFLRIARLSAWSLAFLLLALHDLSGQRALIVTGHDGVIVGEEADELIELLAASGYEVTYLVGPQATWRQVKPAMQGVDVFIYSGHGSSEGYDGTGGLCLNGGGSEIISSFTLEEEVRLAPGALVLFRSVCGGAGSSASDDGDIGRVEAKKRVLAYSRPFFNMGASGYYADNRSGGTSTTWGTGQPRVTTRIAPGINRFLAQMLDGETLQTAFEQNLPSDCRMEYLEAVPWNRSLQVGVTSDYHEGYSTHTTTTNGHRVTRQIPNFRDYDIAFCGMPSFRLAD